MKPPTPIGVIGASLPPATITSARPSRIVPTASPIDVVADCARGGDGERRAARVVTDCELTGGEVDERLDEEVRRQLVHAVGEELLGALDDVGQPPHARADVDPEVVGARPRAASLLGAREPRVGQRLVGGDHRVLA